MNQITRWIGTGGLAVGLAATSHAQITQQANGFLMRMKFKVGETSNFMLETSTGSTGTEIKSVPMKMKVIAVKGNKATVNVKVGAVKGMTSSRESNVEIDSRGRASQEGAGMTGLGSVALPEKAVRIGDKWTSVVEVKTTMGPMKTKTTYTFSGFRGAGATKMALISVETSATNKGLTITGKGAMTLRMADGSLNGLLLRQNISMMPSSKSAGMNMQSKVVVKRV